ncbi:sensor histidine kinase [Sphingorhabdus arenilitoris]|uniref:histidine kinase n=1 Tax=Sphingorhabdus arenilitoris TaxID=1490041 RepID=A0ABV8RC51_9SPHN
MLWFVGLPFGDSVSVRTANPPIGMLRGLGRMAYALCEKIYIHAQMDIKTTALPQQIDTTADMREVYRAAESRAARMRLLTATGRELANATPDNIEQAMQKCADRLAYFVGSRKGRVTLGRSGDGIVIPGPGPGHKPLGFIEIDNVGAEADIMDAEDREAFKMHLELMGVTIDRIEGERERIKLLAALRDREKRLEYMVARIFTAQEEERRRVSQELHDGVAQTATALVRLLEGAGDAASKDIVAAERTRLANIGRDLVKELRAVIGGLRPTLLDDLGLEAALQSLAEGLEEEGFTVSLFLDGEVARLPAPIETALFRVAQEAVSNIRKHAGGPCSVFIELSLSTQDGSRSLCVRDTGVGAKMPPADDKYIGTGQHVGIDVMRERMTAIGGELHWQAGTNGGITVIARLPKETNA